MVDFAKTILPSEAEIRAVLQTATSTGAALEWVQGIVEARRPFVFRSLAWLIKLGVLRLVAQETSQGAVA
jgi:hypothetical protein